MVVAVAASQRSVVAMVMVVWGGARGRGRVPQGGRDGRRLDGDDAGVHHLAVHLHHHLIAPRGGRVVQTLCGGGGAKIIIRSSSQSDDSTGVSE